MKSVIALRLHGKHNTFNQGVDFLGILPVLSLTSQHFVTVLCCKRRYDADDDLERSRTKIWDPAVVAQVV